VAAMKLRCQLFGTRVLGTAQGFEICAATANSTSLLLDCGLRTIVERASEMENRNCSNGTQLIRGGNTMPSAYASWVGQAVILQVAAGDLRVPLRGIIVGESDGAVRFRIGDTWDIDIYKPMILAVEQDNWASIIMN
jgi:hypothetical protein